MKRMIIIVISTLFVVTTTFAQIIEREKQIIGDPFVPYSVTGKTTPLLTTSNEVSFAYRGSTLWSKVINLRVQGTLAYCAMQNGLMILDISDHSNPIFVSWLYLAEGHATDLEVRGNRVYITEWNGGSMVDVLGKLYIIDVSNPETPGLIGSYTAPASAYGLDVVDSLAFVSYGIYSDKMGLLILNVNNPGNISLVIDIPLEAEGMKVRVRGNYAYVIGGGSVWTIDITNPANANVASRFFTGYYPVSLNLGDDDTLLYIGDGDIMWPAYSSAFTVLNVADPENPSVIGRFPLTGSVGDIKVSDSIAFVGNGKRGLKVFNITDPTNPDSIGYYDVPAFTGPLFVEDNMLLLADYGIQSMDVESKKTYKKQSTTELMPGDLLILNVSDPASPTLEGYYSMPGLTGQVIVSGDYAYTLNGHGDRSDVWSMDISGSGDPVIVGCYEAPWGLEEGVIADSLLYVTAGNQGLKILNLSDPANLTLLGQTDSGIGALDVKVRDNLAYVVGNQKLRIFNVINPLSPELMGWTSIIGDGINDAFRVALFNNYAYVVNGPYSDSGTVVDISDSENPYKVGRFYNYEVHSEVIVYDNWLYAAGMGGLQIYDIQTDPTTPLDISIWRYAPSFKCMTVYSNYVLISDGWSGIEIVDISDPGTPVQIGTYNTPGYPHGVTVMDNKIFIADNWSLIVLQHSIPTDIYNLESLLLPNTTDLHQNYPNPFNPETTIKFDISKKTDVALSIYNILGQNVITIIDKEMSAGTYSVIWNGKDYKNNDVASGIYFYKLTVDDTIITKKMTLIR